eukprot:1625325-Amphidinium_carterae.1
MIPGYGGQQPAPTGQQPTASGQPPAVTPATPMVKWCLINVLINNDIIKTPWLIQPQLQHS